ncbi:tRNA pseudouridine(38/39) synthase [Palaemon carinicauda]|uniref:tRNA pseudouridine(38/39) synthase n=1 Tax=Palaemon carinicauda TaxID=392227 RepID=UPI0035B5BFD3
MDPQKTNGVVERDKKDVKRSKNQKSTPISQLTREELEARLMQVEAHNKQLQNLLAKSQGIAVETAKIRKERPFDFSKYSKRHVLLKFAYLGWDYNGFAVQEDTPLTIEAQIFHALLKTRLIESRETSNYHRCGRTDKGVSGFDQVISITLRSRLTSGIGVIVGDEKPAGCVDDDDQEIGYVMLLNKVLPPEIRMLAWCPVAVGFSARFDCSHRTYKYFFPRGNLDIKLMNEAAQHLVGSHDYRNFCKMDVGNGVVNFCRRILKIHICEVGEDIKKTFEVENTTAEDSSIHSSNDVERSLTFSHMGSSSSTETKGGEIPDGYDMCVATLEGQAFLWHQVRAIMAILFLVGERKENPSIVQELLDVDKYPRKPQYCLASDVPLNLYGTTFEGVAWQWDLEVLKSVISQLQALWTQNSVRTTMIRRMLWDLESRYKDLSKGFTSTASIECSENVTAPGAQVLRQYIPQDQCETLVSGARTKVYRPLLSRPTCESLETRVEHYVKRQRLDPDILQRLTSSDASVVVDNSS